MDHANIKALKSMAPKGSKAEIHLLGEFDPKELVIRDPYYVRVLFSFCHFKLIKIQL